MNWIGLMIFKNALTFGAGISSKMQRVCPRYCAVFANDNPAPQEHIDTHSWTLEAEAQAESCKRPWGGGMPCGGGRGGSVILLARPGGFGEGAECLSKPL